jgi:hypothetical protein
MTVQAILAPVFVQVGLTFLLLFWLAPMRTGDYKAGRVRPEDIALRQPNWPERTTKVANAFSNQFELPVLFYVLTILAYLTHLADLIYVVLAWVFVAFRLLQASVHVTSNIVRLRGALFAGSAAVLAMMWIIFGVEVMTRP